MVNLNLVSQEDKYLIAELAKSNMTASTIGNKFGFKALKVLAICESMGVKVRYNQRNSKDAKLIDMVKSQRYSANFIASTLGVCTSTVRAAQRELSLTYSETVKKRNEKIKQVHMLCKDGMITREACAAVGVTVSMYNRLKFEIGLVKKGA
jgi:hypothetical protein